MARPAASYLPPAAASFEAFLARELRLLEALILSEHQARILLGDVQSEGRGQQERISFSYLQSEEATDAAKADGPSAMPTFKSGTNQAAPTSSGSINVLPMFEEVPAITVTMPALKTGAVRTSAGNVQGDEASADGTAMAVTMSALKSGHGRSSNGNVQFEGGDVLEEAEEDGHPRGMGGLRSGSADPMAGFQSESRFPRPERETSTAPSNVTSSGNTAHNVRRRLSSFQSNSNRISPSHLGRTMSFESKETTRQEGRCEGCVTVDRFVSTTWFETASLLNMLLNVFLIGYTTDYRARHRTLEVPFGLIVAESICCFFFILEVTLQLVANFGSFLCGPGRILNTLDLALAIFQVVEITLTLAITENFYDRGFNFVIARGIRIARLVRLVRSVRVMNMCAEVRSTALSFLLSVRPLLGAVTLLVLLTLIFSIIFVEMLLEDMIALPPDSAEAKAFGSILKSVLTLLQSVTGGVDWGEPSRLLPHSGRALFLLFVTWTTLGVFNIVTGSFVAASTNRIREDATQLLYDCTTKHLKDRSDVGENMISKNGLQAALASAPSLKESLNLSSSDIEKLFLLFGTEEDDVLDIDDLIAKLRIVVGPARRLEQEILVRNLCETSGVDRQLTASMSICPSERYRSSADHMRAPLSMDAVTASLGLAATRFPLRGDRASPTASMDTTPSIQAVSIDTSPPMLDGVLAGETKALVSPYSL